MESIALAYFLHSWRWAIRGALVAAAAAAFLRAGWRRRWIPLSLAAAAVFVAYQANFEMAAETMFLQPASLRMTGAAGNRVDSSRLVIGIAHGGQARAYPIQYLGYHHQVVDTIAGKPLIVTYCTVCRTGRVFEPLVDGRPESFRLVGMDRFNAMFEDQTTKSWWRQATGEAVAGPLKGRRLPEVGSAQTELRQWLSLYPHSLIMQPDEAFQAEYDSLSNYEAGRREGRLTRRDTASWQEKSWVVGLASGRESMAYDWNLFERKRIIHDELDGRPVVLVLAEDGKSFFAFERATAEQTFTLARDTLLWGNNRYDLKGTSADPRQPDLKHINAYQEYWHSWRTFHPQTRQYAR
jgi:hypothetical protein